MTREEAIKCLKELPFLSLKSNSDWSVAQDMNNQVAAHMAIKALEQQDRITQILDDYDLEAWEILEMIKEVVKV